ncbi:hypothetical protein, partial [Nocardia sp. NRRL S-836]|uniref:hypothetical protein n=1 Tax=Nocardia sp. NRRL S-836 TaxID=1519492 RepID=UPI0006BEFBF5
ADEQRGYRLELVVEFGVKHGLSRLPRLVRVAVPLFDHAPPDHSADLSLPAARLTTDSFFSEAPKVTR